jgi:N-methylhydantoinase B
MPLRLLEAAQRVRYGDPLERDPERVLHDVRERWVSQRQAEDVYGVVFAASAGLAIDEAATREKRLRLAAARG